MTQVKALLLRTKVMRSDVLRRIKFQVATRSGIRKPRVATAV